MRNSGQGHENLERIYRARHEAVLVRLAESLRKHISELIEGQPRIDRVAARAKSLERFLAKARAVEDGQPKYDEPLAQIQDQVAARIIVFYRADVRRVQEKVSQYFTAIEDQELVPESESEFGYFGRHLVLAIPTDVLWDGMDSAMVPAFFELQIKTLFQHAWAEADHDLGYKPGNAVLTSDQKRKIAFTSAQAWGADLIFNDLAEERFGASGTEGAVARDGVA